MAYAKKTTKNEAYQKLKADLRDDGSPGNAYLFYGEETYLREYYLGALRKKLIPAGFEEFNYHVLDGRDLTAQSLTEMAEAMPMMAERTLIVVTDWDIYKLNEDQRERLIALLEDLPEYCCIVFVYDTVAYKQNKTLKKLCKVMDAHVTPIEFKAQDTSDRPAVPGAGKADRPADGGVSHFPLRRADDRPLPGNRQDRRLCQGGYHYPAGH